MARKWWDRKAQKLPRRDWAELASEWLAYVPDIAEPGQEPVFSVSSLQSLRNELVQVQGDHPYDQIEEIPGLRKAVLHQTVHLYHKAVNAISGAQVHIREGLTSWSLSSAYQSAFFAAKAILGLFGVVFVEAPEVGVFLVDVWAMKKRKPRPIVTGTLHTVRLLRTSRIEHRQVWAFFQKMARKTRVPAGAISRANLSAILELDIAAFAKQRNALHYSKSWPFSDLHNFVVIPDFGRFGNDIHDGSALAEPTDGAFSVALGFVLVRAGYQMLRQIGESAPRIRCEADLAAAMLEHKNCALYQAAFG